MEKLSVCLCYMCDIEKETEARTDFFSLYFGKKKTLDFYTVSASVSISHSYRCSKDYLAEITCCSELSYLTTQQKPMQSIEKVWIKFCAKSIIMRYRSR